MKILFTLAVAVSAALTPVIIDCAAYASGYADAMMDIAAGTEMEDNCDFHEAHYQNALNRCQGK